MFHFIKFCFFQHVLLSKGSQLFLVQATGLLVESMTKKVEVKNEAGEFIHEKVEFVSERFEEHVHSVLPVSRNILQSAVKVVTDISSLDPSDGAVPFWKEAYYSLVMLEKILNRFHHLCFEWDLEVWRNQFLSNQFLKLFHFSF